MVRAIRRPSLRPRKSNRKNTKTGSNSAIGGVITSGDRAQFEQEHRLPGDQVYGGIQDLHFEGTFDKNGVFSVDGHALWDFNDYDLTVELAKPNLGYIKAGYTEFRRLVRWQRRVLSAQ